MSDIHNDKVSLDCSKITTIKEVADILDGLNLTIQVDSPAYKKLKHLVREVEDFDISKLNDDITEL